MKIFFLVSILISFGLQISYAQGGEVQDPQELIYRTFAEKVNDMVHTKLEASFDYDKSQMNGKVWLTMTPHFYSVDTLQLDAKAMDIHKVELYSEAGNKPLEFTYDSLKLTIHLDREYKADEKYTVYIDYTARPNDYKGHGSAAIMDDKGLYFINPKGEEKGKATQIWTQGETESNSVWIPCIDKPNQKSTQEFILTVPDKYVTLSNGKMVDSQKNGDGTRTDTWKMDKPNTVYLFFMGIGDYARIEDHYKDIPVDYYVEPEYKDVAKKIFGKTPEMIALYVEKLGFEYPWNKYDQITGQDYVSGAMENTTCTLHGSRAQQNARELTDGNQWEDVVSHELFHQWFGDLVTCESWAQLTVNESFADFAEILWQEHEYGKDAGQAYFYKNKGRYLNSEADTMKTLVRHFYNDKEDMFDLVSYNKGGAILYMLRDYVGEDAFFKSLHTYLTRNEYGNGNAKKLQQAFEDVSGKNLDWFFNQWYYGAGHPNLDITYDYDPSTKQAKVYVKQLQSAQVFKFPVWVDVYQGDKAKRYSEWIDAVNDTLTFSCDVKPELINFDAKKTLLCNKEDHKTFDEFVFQYKHATNYIDRYEAVAYVLKDSLKDKQEQQFAMEALGDKNKTIRKTILYSLSDLDLNKKLLKKTKEIALNDPYKLVRAAALYTLSATEDKKYEKLYVSCLEDSSYSVAGNAYDGLLKVDESKALEYLPELKKDARGDLKSAVQKADFLVKTDADFDSIYNSISAMQIYEKFQSLLNFTLYLKNLKETDHFKKGIDMLDQFISLLNSYNPQYTEPFWKELEKVKEAKEKELAKNKSNKDVDEQIEYLNKLMEKQQI